MAHVHALADQCPAARPIIHLGATSCFVTDNTDLLLIRESLRHVRDRLVAVIDALGRFAAEHRGLACLGFTHFQPAQPTTVGKRACLWIYDLVLDLEEIERRLDTLRARGVKGTTGTQASFLELFQGDHDKVRRLEQRVAEKMEFDDLLRRDRPDVFAESRHPSARRAVRDRPKRSQSGHRSATAGRPQGDRGTVRNRPGRIVGHGVQAQPHAGRADLLPGPVRDQPAERAPPTRRPPSGWNGPWTTAPIGGWSSRKRFSPSTPS